MQHLKSYTRRLKIRLKLLDRYIGAVVIWLCIFLISSLRTLLRIRSVLLCIYCGILLLFLSYLVYIPIFVEHTDYQVSNGKLYGIKQDSSSYGTNLSIAPNKLNDVPSFFVTPIECLDSVSFNLNLCLGSSDGGEGLTFILASKDSLRATESTLDNGLGYTEILSSNAESVAIEIDTRDSNEKQVDVAVLQGYSPTYSQVFSDYNLISMELFSGTILTSLPESWQTVDENIEGYQWTNRHSDLVLHFATHAPADDSLIFDTSKIHFTPTNHTVSSISGNDSTNYDYLENQAITVPISIKSFEDIAAMQSALQLEDEIIITLSNKGKSHNAAGGSGGGSGGSVPIDTSFQNELIISIDTTFVHSMVSYNSTGNQYLKNISTGHTIILHHYYFYDPPNSYANNGLIASKKDESKVEVSTHYLCLLYFVIGVLLSSLLFYSYLVNNGYRFGRSPPKLTQNIPLLAQRVRSHTALSRPDLALDTLEKHLRARDKHLYDEIIVLKGQLAELDKKAQMLPIEDFNVQRNKLSYAILELVRRLESDPGMLA